MPYSITALISPYNSIFANTLMFYVFYGLVLYYSKMRWNESKKFASGRDLETNLVTSWKGRGRPPGQNPKLECFTKTLDYTFDYIS